MCSLRDADVLPIWSSEKRDVQPYHSTVFGHSLLNYNWKSAYVESAGFI